MGVVTNSSRGGVASDGETLVEEHHSLHAGGTGEASESV